MIRPRSCCLNCKHVLGPLELIPLVSFMLQKGKCRSCQANISRLYPLVELGTGLLFAGAYLSLGLTAELLVALLLISMLSIVFISDLTYMLIPNRILIWFFPTFIVLRLTLIPLDPWWHAVAGSFTGFASVYLITCLSKGGMGGGDIKLFAVLGLVLGWKLTLLCLMLSCFYGAVIGGVGLLTGKIKRRTPIPFGPFIVLGALTAYFYGELLIRWYMRSILPS